MSFSFEQQLAQHCAPALAGIKAANLVSCLKKDFPSFQNILQEYTHLFANTDIRFCVLCECSQKYLLLVYREKALLKQLSNPTVQELLFQNGYPNTTDLSALLRYLQVRFLKSDGFPHEIGLFLGYPPEDVLDFQKYQGKNFQLCGYWKVYNNPQQAQQLFHRYDRCRLALCQRLQSGFSLAKLFVSAA